MTSNSCYRRIWYRTRRLFQNHCQIRYMVQRALPKRGSDHLHSSDNILSRYAPLNIIKKQRAGEMCCFRVRRSIQVPGIILLFKRICARAINPLYKFLTTHLKELYHQCKVGLFSRTVPQICSDFVKNGIREVACA